VRRLGTSRVVRRPDFVRLSATGREGVVARAGPIYQQFAVCLHATALTDQRPQPDNKETAAATWFDPEATNQLSMHRAIRLRLDHALNEPNRPYFD
jgi:hypothetical protein